MYRESGGVSGSGGGKRPKLKGKASLGNPKDTSTVTRIVRCCRIVRLRMRPRVSLGNPKDTMRG